MVNFSIGRNPINFNLRTFLDSSAKVGYNMKFDYDALPPHEPLERVQINLRELLPTISSVDMNEVYLEVARCKTDIPTFCITTDKYVVSDNIELIKQLIITDINSTKLVKCVMINKSLNELLGIQHVVVENGSGDMPNVSRGYGTQGPEQSGKMSDVKFPSVTASSEMPDENSKGSGDLMIGNNKRKKLSITISELKELAKSYKTVDEVLEYYESAINEDVIEDLKKDLHFENSAIDMPFEFFVNIPVIRKAVMIDTEFSCNTLEGITCGNAGDFLVVGVDGEIYPCASSIFNKTYQKVQSFKGQ